jgi:hypothetical protein
MTIIKERQNSKEFTRLNVIGHIAIYSILRMNVMNNVCKATREFKTREVTDTLEVVSI